MTADEKRKYNRLYYKNNRAKIISQNSDYRKRNKDKARIWEKRYRDKNKQAVKDRHKAWRHKNMGKWVAYSNRWRRDNPKKYAAGRKSWRDKNANEINAKHKVYMKSHPWLYRTQNARRRADQHMATPDWVNRKDLAAIYRQAELVSISTGIAHHVDHVWPLRGNGFSGLHVPWNLQVITAEENLRKSNHRP